MKHILNKLNSNALKVNNGVEDFLTVAQSSHKSSITLFAVVVMCCLHLYQIHTPIFLICVIGIALNQDGRNLMLKIAGLLISVACLSMQIMPIYDHNLTDAWNDTLDLIRSGDINVNDSQEALDTFMLQYNVEEEELMEQMLLNYIFTLVMIALNCKMYSVSKLGNYGVSVMFPNVTRYEADRNMLYCIKYLVNYIFYKFGMEICFFAVALQVTACMNTIDIIPMMMLWFCVTSRSTVRKSWTYLRTSLLISLGIKYIVKLSDKPITIFYTANYLFTIPGLDYELLTENHITKQELIWGFAVILLVDYQLWVFNLHWEYYGGSNKEIWRQFDDLDIKNRIQDFLIFPKNFFDMLKSFILPSFPWMVLVFILMTCIFSHPIYSMIYVILVCGVFLKGSSRLYMLPMKVIMRRWQLLIYYTVFCIMIKFLTVTVLQNFIVDSVKYGDYPYWIWLSFECPYCILFRVPDLVDPFTRLTETAIMDAVYLAMLLLVRRFIGSLYFLHLKNDVRGRDYLDEWGAPLLHKATLEQNKKKKLVMEKVKATVENRRANVLTHQPSLKNAVVDQGFKLILPVGSIEPYSLTEWFWSTTVAYRFTEFGIKKQLQIVKEEKRQFQPELKMAPTEEDLEELWKQFLIHSLSEVLQLNRPIQLVHSIWMCLKAHSQYVCFIFIFALQGLVYKTMIMLFLPFSVLYASWRFPRAPTRYWHLLLGFTIVMMLLKAKYLYRFFDEFCKVLQVPNDFASGVPVIEALLFLSILWHRSNLRPLGLWNQPLSEEILPQRIATVDVYAGIALLELANLILVSLSFSSFAAEQSDGGVVEYVTKDNVPLAFLIVLLIHLLSMSLDRILYVSAAFKWRGGFHTIVWFGSHIWLFYFVPSFTEKPFGNHLAQQVYYMIQCLYLLLSAYQVRNQHSRCSAVSVLCQRFTRTNYLLFKTYCNIPFVEPIRRTLDFLFTKTLLTREEFVIIESIFEKVFEVKCERVIEYKALLNRKSKPNMQFTKTIAGLLGIIIILIFLASPVIYFIMEEKLTSANSPTFMTVELHNPSLGTLYTQQINHFDTLNEIEYDAMREVYKTNRKAKTFLADFTYRDVFVAHLPTLSLYPWNPSESRTIIAERLRKVPEFVSLFNWHVNRDSPGENDLGSIIGVIEAPSLYLELRQEQRNDSLNSLASMIASNSPDSFKPVEMPDVLPKYTLLTKKGASTSIRQLASGKHDDGIHNLLMSLTTVDNGVSWKLEENCEDVEYAKHIKKLPKDSKCETVDIYIFSEHSSLFGFISGVGGLVGLYAGVVFTVWRLIAAFWKRELHEIIYDEMVSVDRVLQLCLDIYQSRITGEMELELDLGVKLINIFCSPMEIDAWTRGESGVDARA